MQIIYATPFQTEALNTTSWFCSASLASAFFHENRLTQIDALAIAWEFLFIYFYSGELFINFYFFLILVSGL